MPLPLLMRPAVADDLDQIANLERLAFAPELSLEQIKTDWFGNTLDHPGRSQWLAVDPQTNLVVGTYAALDLGIWFMGQTIPSIGLGGVAVAPHKRGQRVARHLLQHAIAQAQSQHTPLMMLYPFQHGFYRQLGWEYVAQPRKYRVCTRHLPLYPERGQIRPYDPVYQDHLATAYNIAAAGQNGWLCRSPFHWEKRLKPVPGQNVYVYMNDSSPLPLEGYVIWQFTQQCDQRVVIVHEWVALTAAAYRGILGFLASLRDQVPTIIWNTNTHDPFPHLLTEQDGAWEISGGFMWRLVDIPRAFSLRPITPGDSFEISFTVTDPQVDDTQEQRFMVQFRDRQMHYNDFSTTSPHITLSIRHLTQLFSGFRRATELHWTGEIQVDGEGEFLPQLDRAWATTPPFCWDFF